VHREKQSTKPPPQALIQGTPAKIRLDKIIAFDRENMRRVKLVEEARRLRAEKVPRDDQAYKDLLNEIDDLMGSIPIVGLLEPLIVYKTDREGFYKLKAGSRRMAALLLTYGEETEVQVMIRDDDLEELTNLAENLARRDVEWTMTADAFYKQRKKHSAEVIAQATGFSISGVNNLIRVRSKIHPRIWAVLVKYAGTPQAQTQEKMVKLCALSHEEQLKAWEEMTNPKGKNNEERGNEEEEETTHAAPVLDLETLDGLKPETVPRQMDGNEVQQLIAILKTAIARLSEHGKQYAEELAVARGALGALEAYMGADSDEVGKLRQALLRARTAGETPAPKRTKATAKVRKNVCGKSFKKGNATVECDKAKGHTGAHGNSSGKSNK
jgi:ParB/RepB/Spo0J family partition protein